MFRRMTDADLPEVLAIEKAGFPQPWSAADFDYELHRNPCSRLYVMTDGGRLTAFADLWIMFEKAEVANIAVAPAARRRGIGRQMMARLEACARRAHCESMSLEVRVTNRPAQGLYDKCGFMTVSIRRDYYADHSDAYLMMKGI